MIQVTEKLIVTEELKFNEKIKNLMNSKLGSFTLNKICLQMSDYDTGYSTIEITRFRNERKIRISSMIKVSHMHSTIKHDSLPSNRDNNAAFSYFLSGT